MLKNILNEIQEEILNTEFGWDYKGSFYRIIDGNIVENLKTKLEGYTIKEGANLKDTDSQRFVFIYQGTPPGKRFSLYEFTKDRPCLAIAYKIKLQSKDINGNWNSYKQYNLKDFTFTGEYNFTLEEKFKELTESKNNSLDNERQKLEKSKDEFLKLLDSLKSTVEQEQELENKDEDKYYLNPYSELEREFKKHLRDYERLIELKK